MEWLLSSITAALVGAAALSAVFSYLSRTEGLDFLKIWSLAWAAAVLHFLLQFFISGPGGMIFLSLSLLAALAAGYLLLRGTALLNSRKVDVSLQVIAAILLLWIALAAFFGFFHLLNTLPIHLFWGGAAIWMGYTVLQISAAEKPEKSLVANPLFILGLLLVCHPFFRLALLPAAAIYGAIALTEVALAVGILMLYLQRSHKELADASAKIPLLMRMVEFTVPETGLAENAERFHLFMEKTADLVYLFHCQPEFRLIYVNPAYSAVSGYPDKDFYSDPSLSLEHIHPADRPLIQEICAGSRPDHSLSIRWTHRDGSLVWTEQWLSPITDEAGKVLFMMGIGRQVTPAEEPAVLPPAAAADSEAVAQQADSPAVVAAPAGTGAGEVLSPPAAAADGAEAAAEFADSSAAVDKATDTDSKPIGSPPAAEMTSAGAAPSLSPGKAAASAGPAMAEPPDRIIPAGTEPAESAAAKAAASDPQAAAYPLAESDPAGLPGRRHFLIQLDKAVRYARDHQEKLAVLYLDLDKTKQVSKLLGHQASDQFIQSCAARIKSVLQEYQLLAHPGGDEFLILAPEIVSYLDVENLAERILQALEKPASMDLYQFPVSPGIGIAIYPLHGEDPETLIHDAELAAIPAKKSALQKYNLYDTSLRRELTDQVQLEEDLRQALSRNEFTMEYQAQFTLSPRRELAGAEALLRWRHPQKGLLLPGSFLPMAEETGLIHTLGEWTLEAACRQNNKWHQAGYRPFPVAVNVSASQFRQRGFVDMVNSVITRTGLPPELLILEIKGATAFENVTLTQDKLRRLRSIGIQVALDNFGSGALSLHQLKDVPVRKIKIDRSFLKDLSSSSHMEEILSIIINMGRQLGLTTLTEGVETQQQLDLLTKFDCLQAQGNFLSPPLAGKDFEIRYLLSRRK